MAKGDSPRVLVVEDDGGHAALMRRALRNQPYDVSFASTLDEARPLVDQVDLIVVDWRLPDGHGTDLLDGRPRPVVVMTSHGDEHLAVDAMKAGALDYVVKSSATLREFDRVIERNLRAWRNIEQRREAERAFTTSEARWRSIVESSPDVILLTDDDGRILFTNRGLRAGPRVLGGRHLADVFGEGDMRGELEQVVRRVCRGRFVERVTVSLKAGSLEGGSLEAGSLEAGSLEAGSLEAGSLKGSGDDGPLFYELRIAPVMSPEGGMVVSASDVTAQRRGEVERAVLEEQLQQAQRLETIGTLAGGVAHDFNNILQAILGFAQLATRGLDAHRNDGTTGADARADLQAVVEAAHRGRDLVRQILAFSRPRAEELRPIRVVDAVDEALRLIRVAMPSQVAVEVDHGRPELRVEADPTQLHQVIANLCTNALQAMADGGRLSVTTSEGPIPHEVRATHDLPAGPYAQICVTDTGAGMDEATRRRIFEPFFTTKPTGVGTGLGLAVVHGIVRSHGGAITVESELGRGTAISVFLPRLAPQAAASVREVPVSEGNGQHVMFVDDEPMVIRVAEEMLERFGYRVTSFGRPHDALARFEAQPDLFDAVVTDLTMPVMTGVDLAASLHALRSDIPIVLTTGYGGRVPAGPRGVRRILEKPYDVRELSSTLREVLNEDESTL
ncbi:MAG: response regulator [Myxococcota bacterium]